MMKIVLLVLALVATAVSAQQDPSCQTKVGMTLDQCRALNAYWASAAGQAACTFPDPYYSPPVVWVGSGCQRPCAAKAIKMGRNPTKYCKSIGTYPTFNDGGCKLSGISILPSTSEVTRRELTL